MRQILCKLLSSNFIRFILKWCIRFDFEHRTEACIIVYVSSYLCVYYTYLYCPGLGRNDSKIEKLYTTLSFR